MEILYITIPLVIIVGSLVVAAFIWMAKKGQFDDLDGAAYRILLDDEPAPQQEAKPGEKQENTDKTEQN